MLLLGSMLVLGYTYTHTHRTNKQKQNKKEKDGPDVIKLMVYFRVDWQLVITLWYATCQGRGTIAC